MATKHDNPCFKKAGDDEPIFVLRVTDKFAPILVRIWATLADASGTPGSKVQSADTVADEMEVWQKQRGSKYPD